MYSFYCLQCKQKTDSYEIENLLSKNNKTYLSAKCKDCSKKKTKFIKPKEGGDIQKLLSKLPFTTTGIPGELHLPFPTHNFVGPGTNLNIRLNPDDTTKEWSKPIDKDDEIAYQHDLAYREAGDDINKKHEADKIMLYQLDSITDPTIKERLHRTLIKTALKTKLFLGVGLVQERDKEQYAQEIHKPYRRTPIFRKVKTKYKDQIWSADLVIMPPEFQGRNGKYKYILTVIDLYTKYAWAIPLKTKTGEDVKNGFVKILKESKRKPKKLWCDKGKEFYNSIMNNFLEKHNVKIYSVESEFKAGVVERFNRTLKEKMWKQFTIQGNQKWFDILPKLLHDYNNNFHRTIKTTPTNASEHPEKIFDFVMENNDENDRNLSKKQLTPKLKIGDRVRVVKYKYILQKDL